MRGWRPVLALVAMALVAPGAAGADGPAAYQVDPAHAGLAPGTTFAPPLGKRWVRRDLVPEGGSSSSSDLYPVSFPVMAEGKIFLTAGSNVYALDHGGNTVWSRPAAANGVAYDNGRVFVIDNKGVMQALSAADGSLIWTTEVSVADEFGGTAPLTASGDFVYGATEDRMFAVRQAEGIELWSEAANAFVTTVPAVDADKAYSAGGCSASALERRVGVEVWSYSGSCGGGASLTTAVLHGDRVYALNQVGGGVVLDALTGLLQDTFTATQVPAFADGVGYFANGRELVARDLASGVVRWRYSEAADPYDTAMIAAPPLVAGGHVYVVNGGKAVALERETGAKVWQSDLGSQASSSSSGPRWPGIGAAGDLLVVSYADRVVGYTPGPSTPGVNDPDKPARSTSTLELEQVTPRRLVHGQQVTLSGEFSSPGTGPVVIQADRWPFDGRFRAVRRFRPDQFFQLSIRPRRNTRYRAVFNGTFPGMRTRAFKVYMDIAYRFGVRALSRSRVRVRLRAAAPRAAKLRGSRYFVYFYRRGAAARRIGTLKMRGSRTRVKDEAVLATPALRRTDRFFACRRERRDDGFGEYDPAQARCGAKLLR
jgi:outer membrane protein assembly factor BamB